MNLVEQRNAWRKAYEEGGKPDYHFLNEYRKYRDSELWRSTRLMEELFEYIVYLEHKLNV